MSEENKNNNLILGGAALLGILAVCGGIYYMNDDTCNNDDDSDNDFEYQQKKRRSMYEQTGECYEGYGCGGSSSSMVTTTPAPVTLAPTSSAAVQDNYIPPSNSVIYNEGYKENMDNGASPASTPLGFSEMAGGEETKENYGSGSDYQILGDYSDGSQNIPVYDEKSGNIGLPVPSMVDISSGEDNKYVYDRTIGTIGFTSTKIGGRRRANGDNIRGDLPILPDENSSFQVSPDILNSLVTGFFGLDNYEDDDDQLTISGGGAGQRALTLGSAPVPLDLNSLRDQANQEVINETVKTLTTPSTTINPDGTVKQNAPMPLSAAKKAAQLKVTQLQKKGKVKNQPKNLNMKKLRAAALKSQIEEGFKYGF